MRRNYLTSLTAAACLCVPAQALVVPPPVAFHPPLDISSLSIASLAPNALVGDVAQQTGLATLLAAGKSTADAYTHALAQYPLPTKMATGGVLAIGGDAVAQASQTPGEYDRRRAISFVAFDIVYRAFQHASFPVIVKECQGQYLGPLASFLQSTLHQSIPTDYIPAIEQTFANQLLIIPFLYYPVFFSLTGWVQGLSVEASVERFKQTIVPLMKRNLLFWIPFQFIQFAYIDEDLQVPFVCAVGLMWTIILSFSAGSATSYSNKVPAMPTVAEEEQPGVATQKGLEPVTQTTSN